MADYQLPPWLGPVNPAPYFQQGVSQGASIAESQNRTELAIAEMTLRREAQQRAQDAQNLAAMRTVQDMQIQKERQDEAARQAAIRWQGQQEYGSLVSQGMSPDEAFARTAHKIIPNQLGQFVTQRATQAAITQRAGEAQAERNARFAEANSIAKQRLEAQKEHWKAIENAPKSFQKTPEQAAKEKNLDIQIRSKNAAIKDAAARGFGPEDKQTRDTISGLETELEDLMRQREELYRPAQSSTNSVSTNAFPVPIPPPSTNTVSRFGEGKPLDKDMAKAFLRQANGKRDLAEKLARDAGYMF